MATYRIDAAGMGFDELSAREWMLADRVGGYAMGTCAGANTRKYHGLLVSTVGPGLDRWVLLDTLDVWLLGEEPVPLCSHQYSDVVHPSGWSHLAEVEVSESVRFTYRVAAGTVIQTITVRPGEVHVTFESAGLRPQRLAVRPLVSHRRYHENFRGHSAYPEAVDLQGGTTLVRHSGINLRLDHPGAYVAAVNDWYRRFWRRREAERGLEAHDDLFCPVELVFELESGKPVELVAGHVPPSTGIALPAGDLTSRFLISLPDRPTIIAGYPWFTDWGRDTMISLPGICLGGRDVAKAREILSGYGRWMRKGLIPNRFPEHGEEPEYNTADATLWFVNAAWLTLCEEWNSEFAALLAPLLTEVLQSALEGTSHGIKVDPEDGLLTQGTTETQLTWMDARAGGAAVTPRNGKAVEINGLWINALRCMQDLHRRVPEIFRDGSAEQLANQAETSFGIKFWFEDKGFYRDVVEPDDESLRPNQLIAMSLPFAPARDAPAISALDVIDANLLTPYGLRTLGPDEEGYRGRFEGVMDVRDAAYHQGTVWPWLLGPYVEAVLKVTGDVSRARRALGMVPEMLATYGLDGIAEVYDGDPPHRPGGCPWQAWSAAEVSRALALCDAYDLASNRGANPSE